MRVSFRLSSFQHLHNRWIEKVLECMHSSSANIEGRWLGRDNDEGTTWPAVSIDNGTILAWFHIGTSSPCIISSWTLKSFFFSYRGTTFGPMYNLHPTSRPFRRLRQQAIRRRSSLFWVGLRTYRTVLGSLGSKILNCMVCLHSMNILINEIKETHHLLFNGLDMII